MNIRMSLLAIATLGNAFSLQAKVVRVTNESNYKQLVASNDKPTLVEFAAEWCSVCTGIQKPFEDVSNDPEFAHVAFVQVDVDKCDGLCKERGIVGVPTFVYIQEGKEKIKETGVQKIEEFSSHVRGNLREHFSVAQNRMRDESMMQQMPAQEEISVTEITVESPMPEPGIFDRILAAITMFVMMIVTTIKNIVLSVIEAIRNFFAK